METAADGDVTQTGLPTEQEAQALLRAFFDSTLLMMGIVEMLEDDILHIQDQPATARFFGRNHEETHNRKASELGVPPEIIALWLEHYRQAALTGAPVRFEYQHPTTDGLRLLSVRVSRISQGDETSPRFAYIIEDVTEQRRRAETTEALLRNRAVEQRAVSILESISDAFFSVDREWRFTYVNREAERLLKTPRAQLLGRNLWEVFADAEEMAFGAEYHRAMREKDSVEFEAFYPPLDSWYHVRALPVEDGLAVYFRDVTESREVEVAIRQNQAFFQILNDAVPDLVWVTDASYTIEYVNRRWRDYTGLTAEEVNRAGYRSVYHPDDQERIASLWEQASSSGQPFEGEYRYRRHDGEYRWFWRRAVPLKDASGKVVRWVGVSTDLTERKRLEGDLRRKHEQAERERRRLRAVLDILPVGLFLTDAKGGILEQNEVARAIWGMDAPFSESAESYGEDYKGWWPQTGQRVESHEWAMARALSTGEPVSAEEVEIETRGGQRKAILNFALPIRNEEGEIDGGVTVNVDITDRKRLEEALRKQADALMAADRAKNEFLAMLGHELRNPLGAISNATELLRLRSKEEDGFERPLDILGRQVQQMNRLVGDLLDVARITTGRLELRPEPVDLVQVVHTAVEASQPLIDAHRHQRLVELLDTHLWLRGDTARLQQVVGNLLSNAAKYTQPGGSIRVALERDDGDAILRVEDNGQGIPPDLLPHVFDLFTQAETTLDRPHGGLGIGLALVKRIVEMHGGSVTARSGGPGQGSEFTVRLPLMTGTQSSDTEAQDSPSVNGEEPLHVLIVEDERDAAESLGDLLEMAGHTVDIAGDEASALESVLCRTPDVVLLDIGLPEVDGYEVARRMRLMAGLRDTMLVAMTGYGQEQDRNLSREAGMDEHLVKPVPFQSIQSMLSEFARNRRARPCG